MSLLALCPSRGRPGAAHATLASFLETSQDDDSRLLFIVDRDDPTRDEYPADHVLLVPPGGCMGAALASALKPGILRDATGVGMIGDDNRFRTPGWDLTFRRLLEESPGIVYGDDGFQHDRLPTSWWLSRPLVDEFGMTDRNLKHFYMDNYWLELGIATGTLRYVPEVVIEHLHPLAGKADDDAIYQRGHRFAREDRKTHLAWRNGSGKARDILRLRRVIGHKADAPRRVLADWHHPSLWESFELLFSDRFGWSLFSPIGDEWMAHGWKLENGTPGWSASRYLNPPGAVDRGTYWDIPSLEYPGRVRKGVTWQQAKAMRWDFVLSSVPVHQRTWGALAQQFGARCVHQVGNAKHMIDRGVRQIVIASAKVQGAAVTYHQEFDLETFGRRPVGDPRLVASFMLRLASTSCPYQWIAEAPGIRWEAWGAASMGDPDYLAPASAVADRMAAAGWIWHDKKIGDGYGHVLWNAAAMGRPLIGHASHYHRLLGEPLWTDLETCLDLDRHDPGRVIRLVRAIADDPEWHEAMGDAIRERFDKLVDFPAEAAAIHAVLTR